MGQVSSTNTNFSGRDDRQNGAWTITSDRWKSYGSIVLPINPESLEVGMRLRAAEVQMQGGKYITYSRRERDKSNFEFPVIAFKFNSGNIQPIFSEAYILSAQRGDKNIVQDIRIPNKDNVGEHRYGAYLTAGFTADKNRIPELYDDSTPVGIQNLYALLNLVNDTWMLETGTKEKPNAVLNRIIVSTSSLAFPSLTFYGFLDEAGLQWSESADQFNNFDTSFNLVVTRTSPRLGYGQLSNLISHYKSSMFDGQAPATQYGTTASGLATDAANSTCREDGQTPQADPNQVCADTSSTSKDTSANVGTSSTSTAIGGIDNASDYFAKYWSNSSNKA
jgi:hypothetical protein